MPGSPARRGSAMDEQCQQPPRFKRPPRRGMQMPDTATWTAHTFLNVARGGLANATAGGRIHAIGGCTSDFSTPLASVEAHQPGTGTWQLVAPMLTPRGNAGAAAVGNRIYAFGGFDTPDTGTDLAERFDRSANQWEQIRRLPVATIGPGVAALGGRIFVVGGGTSNAIVTSVHVYNPQTDTFSEAAPMPTARQLLKVTELGGRLYAIGGGNDTGFLATVERYTPATDTWETVTPMSTPRGNPGVVSAAGRIFVVGGASDVSGAVAPTPVQRSVRPEHQHLAASRRAPPCRAGLAERRTWPGQRDPCLRRLRVWCHRLRPGRSPTYQPTLSASGPATRVGHLWQAWAAPVGGHQCRQLGIHPGGRVLATAVAATSSAFRRPTSSRTYALATATRSGRASVDLVVVSDRTPVCRTPRRPVNCLISVRDDPWWSVGTPGSTDQGRTGTWLVRLRMPPA